MKRILFLLIALISLNLYSQDTLDRSYIGINLSLSNVKNNYTVGNSFTYGYNFNKFGASLEYSTYSNSKSSLRSLELDLLKNLKVGGFNVAPVVGLGYLQSTYLVGDNSFFYDKSHTSITKSFMITPGVILNKGIVNLGVRYRLTDNDDLSNGLLISLGLKFNITHENH